MGLILSAGLSRRARVAGGVYLLSVPVAVFSLMYVPGRLIVHGDAGATLARIGAHEALFRWGIAGEIGNGALWIVVTWALYGLLAEIDRGQAWLMAALSLAAVPVMTLSVLGELAVLTMMHSAAFQAAFTLGQLQQLVALALRINAQAYGVAAIFWGLWLFPFAILVWRSGFLPRFLAVLLGIGGLGYIVPSLTALLAPGYAEAIAPAGSIASAIGELPIIAWLLVMGAGRPPSRAGSA